jgi:hypothetical protein
MKSPLRFLLVVLGATIAYGRAVGFIVLAIFFLGFWLKSPERGLAHQAFPAGLIQDTDQSVHSLCVFDRAFPRGALLCRGIVSLLSLVSV